MKKIMLVVVFGLCASSAMAISRYDTPSMSCSAVHDKIAQEGEVVLQHPSSTVKNLTVYDRYVSNSAACVGRGVPTKASVPTSDDPSCKVQLCAPATGRGHNRKG
ncbi:hypothetical protein LJR251_003666 [Rhizobium rhizogenes]|jgi:hypothetical protein|uniref:hypothetical protein n=1 Tax=Rhizobium rhizogenes TaxID=359 RepID=UPI003ECF6776